MAAVGSSSAASLHTERQRVLSPYSGGTVQRESPCSYSSGLNCQALIGALLVRRYAPPSTRTDSWTRAPVVCASKCGPLSSVTQGSRSTASEPGSTVALATSLVPRVTLTSASCVPPLAATTAKSKLGYTGL